MLKAWLRFFRVVNLPTVPGDVLVGAASVLSCATLVARTSDTGWAVPVVAASLSASAVYLFGLADNDLVGADADRDRPIPEGLISLRAARVARGLCLLAALVVGAVANLPPDWWIVTAVLVGAVVVYNRTKWCLVMGLCRGLNVAGGAAALSTVAVDRCRWLPLVLAAVWTLYIAGVTKYSEGEAEDPAKRCRVGWLIGALVYLQLAALIVFGIRPLLVAGAVLLVLLRFLKHRLPGVRAS